MLLLQVLLATCWCGVSRGVYFNSAVYSERLVEVEGEMLALCHFIVDGESRLHAGVDVHNFSSVHAYVLSSRRFEGVLLSEL